ncbi:TIGR00730 family Rossman fold protein [Roseibium sp. RKSG952]|uniref:LOG family protein n=1 Tax=Roseibium sp. RKSG952 TaxID=2529384 RepID=UPI0012BC0417|nr:TIGR00730 family Rossman fold protein [Roseibium sp. RKSG952]MTH97963.1 TIGR00730 family Rossman fold protein [Roseibium sp. RKSG952]
MKSVCVFCGSSPKAVIKYGTFAREAGAAIARAGLTLVYGGASVGLMGEVAGGALAAGGKVIGVQPRSLQDAEPSLPGLSELHVVDTMHERKALMAEFSDGFIALPGGAGTLEEIFEVWTWNQIGVHEKPCGFVNVLGFYNDLLGFLDHQMREGFMRPELRDMVQVAPNTETMLRIFGVSNDAPLTAALA